MPEPLTREERDDIQRFRVYEGADLQVDRYEATVRDLEAKLDHERKRAEFSDEMHGAVRGVLAELVGDDVANVAFVDDAVRVAICRLRDQLDHERLTNTALRLEIDAWRRNDEGRAVRLRAALGRFAYDPRAREALAADREGR